MWIAVALGWGCLSAAPAKPGASGVAAAPAPAPETPLPPSLGKPAPDDDSSSTAEKSKNTAADRLANLGRKHPVRRPENSPPNPRRQASWLGVNIMRLPPEVRAQLPGLAPRVGFVIKSLDRGGPAENAGLKPNDVLWKINGQILVNEAQLWVLLGIWKPGEVVEVEYFRGGRPATAKLTLGEAPPPGGFTVTPSDLPFVVGPPGIGMPLHIVNVPRREASIEHDDGRAVLTFDQSGFHVKITDSKGKSLYDGPLFDANRNIQVPEVWKKRVESLYSTLTESLKRSRGSRPPRMRVIPKSKIHR